MIHHPPTRREIAAIALRALFITVLLAAVIAGFQAVSEPASAQSTVTPIYNGTNTDVNNESWTMNRTNVTLDNVTAYVTRVGTFVIGTETQSSSVAGSLLTGLLVFGFVITMLGSSSAGVVAGGAIGLATASALVAVNIAPVWIYVVALAATGILITAIYIRVTR